MAYIEGFQPICSAHAHTLILGSMPSRESISQHRYYAHPRNSFWPIVSSLFEFTENSYQQNVHQLTRNGIAVWDVLKTCFRSGSLDSDIDDKTIVTNDFQQFFANHPNISRVFFNGAKAESVYLKHVLLKLDGAAAELNLQRLPSTSPAHASMNLEQKKDAWRVILDTEVE